jgi:uncharacterized protein (TIGR00369 family)
MNENCTHKQPNASTCFVCGRDNPIGLKMQFYDDDIDTVSSTLTLEKPYEGYPGIVHGGILASILDEVVGRVAMVGDHHHFMMTVNMKVQYRNPVPVGTQIVAQGKAVRLKGRIGKAQGKIFLPDGSIACEAELTLADMPETIKSDERVAALGWRVDPD